MMKAWSSGQSLGPSKSKEREATMIYGMIDTDLQNRAFSAKERVAKAERYHALTRSESVTIAPSRPSLASRLAMVLARPIRTPVPQHGS
jgi:hypothetical protein